MFGQCEHAKVTYKTCTSNNQCTWLQVENVHAPKQFITYADANGDIEVRCDGVPFEGNIIGTKVGRSQRLLATIERTENGLIRIDHCSSNLEGAPCGDNALALEIDCPKHLDLTFFRYGEPDLKVHDKASFWFAPSIPQTPTDMYVSLRNQAAQGISATFLSPTEPQFFRAYRCGNRDVDSLSFDSYQGKRALFVQVERGAEKTRIKICGARPDYAPLDDLLSLSPDSESQAPAFKF